MLIIIGLLKFILIISAVKVIVANPTDWSISLETKNPAFDPALYKDALDSEVCSEQLEYIRQNVLLRLQFLDSGLRLPKGITQFNFIDLGNFDQCLGLEKDIGSSVIEGKYCKIQGPLFDNFNKLAEVMNWSEFDAKILNKENIAKIKRAQILQNKVKEMYQTKEMARSIPDSASIPAFTLAVCVPKTCTTEEGISRLLYNLTSIGFQYEELFCRFKNDKPWVPGDYVAIIILSFIGLLTIISTWYDLHQIFIIKTDPKSINELYRSFSVYTNTKRLMRFTSSPTNLSCVDGIRAISMFWVVVGHTYVVLPPSINLVDSIEWILSAKSIWIVSAPYAVDTFFTLAGMLLVYTTVGKLTGANLIKNLHLYYVNRLVRMFPLLALIVLLQATVFHRIADGPNWDFFGGYVNLCRTYWWSTLLHVQNLVNVDKQCIAHAWYLAIDIHLYFISPIVLYWLLSGKRTQAWFALTCGILVSLSAATTYSFINQFMGWVRANEREGGNLNYHWDYYFFTLTRAPPFFVGMIFGYLLNIWKGHTPQIPRVVSGIYWILSGSTLLGLMYITHVVTDPDYVAGVFDDLMNSFGRSLWAMSVGWIIFACQYGYGGPVNWFLSLDIWKLPSRISFAIYLFHFKFQFILYSMSRVIVYFSDFVAMYEFFAQATITYGIAFAVTVLIDSPFSILFKKLIGEGPKRTPVRKEVANKQ